MIDDLYFEKRAEEGFELALKGDIEGLARNLGETVELQPFDSLEPERQQFYRDQARRLQAALFLDLETAEEVIDEVCNFAKGVLGDETVDLDA